ncbi:zinc finger B-box domain-containing protein 1 [Rhynochetos jubatus]
MNVNDFVILPGSKTGTSVRLKAKTVRELHLKKVQLEVENKEMEKKLRQLQSHMSREKEERKKSSAYHWKSGQAGPMTTQARVSSQSKAKDNKVSSGKVKLQILGEQIPGPVKEPFKHEVANAVAHEESEAKRIARLLLTEADPRVGKLEVVDHFSKKVNPEESKINHKQKKANSKHRLPSDKFPSLLVSVGSAEKLSAESTCAGLENQDKGLLLNGTFNEEESAVSFQEALIQWRKSNHGHRGELHAREVLSEPVGICEVQTNLTVTKEPIQIEFKEDGLSYMEKLLLKKYRRTPVDQISGNCIKDLRPVQTLSVHQAVIGEGAEGDAEVDDLTVEEVKRYWTSVFREEIPNTASDSAESSLKIEFLDDVQDITKRQKPVSTWYWGLRRSFVLGANPKQVVLGSRSSLRAGSSSVGASIPFPGDGKWVAERSLSEYADDSIVQGVLESQLNRTSRGLETQNRISPLMVAWRSYPGNDSRRPWSTNMLHSKLSGNCPTNTQPRPGSSPVHTVSVGAEIPNHTCLDVTKQGEYLWEYAADQEALLTLEKELQSYAGPEKCYSSTSEEVTSSRQSEMMCGSKDVELKDHSRADTLRGWDESQVDDEEEILEDKQQVLALQ